MRVHVIGTGLIGTSVGLALAGEAEVLLSDVSGDNLRRAVARGAGRAWDGHERADLALVCAPPAKTASLIADVLVSDLALNVSHVASQQSQVQAEVEALVDVRAQRMCGGHPLAGRERSGPEAATSRLFLDRPWVVCAGPSTTAEAAQAVVDLAVACGAVPVHASAEEHDAAVALVSHLPQVAASAVAARLDEEANRRDGFDPTRLAGPGVQDTTRIAASDPDLWVEVLTRNAAHVAPLVRALSADLAATADALDRLGQEALPPDDARQASLVLRGLLDRGRSGRERLPLKRGVPGSLAQVVVAITDRPGQLASVLVTAAAAAVNVEDVRVEHLPGRPRGLVELLVPAPDVARARRALTAAGWEVLDGG